MNSDAPSTPTRDEFCLALKAARERRGVTLAEIAETTKIPASHFADLERNDLRHWPKGLFRRSFFRDYVMRIGVPVSDACAEFARLFPDEALAKPAERIGAPAAATQTDEARLALDGGWHGPRPSGRTRVLAAVVDAGVVIFASAALAWLDAFALPTTTAFVAMAYFSVGTTVLGASPGTRAVSGPWSLLDVLRQAPAKVAAAWTGGVYAITHVFAAAGEQRAEHPEDPQDRPWVTDARRVGPPTRLRVRIKLPH